MRLGISLLVRRGRRTGVGRGSRKGRDVFFGGFWRGIGVLAEAEGKKTIVYWVSIGFLRIRGRLGGSQYISMYRNRNGGKDGIQNVFSQHVMGKIGYLINRKSLRDSTYDADLPFDIPRVELHLARLAH